MNTLKEIKVRILNLADKRRIESSTLFKEGKYEEARQKSLQSMALLDAWDIVFDVEKQMREEENHVSSSNKENDK